MFELQVIRSESYEPEPINDLANRCGWFNGSATVNNGYGCDHEDQEEVEYGQGKCYSFSCPIAHEMDAQDWRERDEDPENYEPMEWVLQHSPTKNESITK